VYVYYCLLKISLESQSKNIISVHNPHLCSKTEQKHTKMEA